MSAAIIRILNRYGAFIVIAVATCLFSFDLFQHAGEPATFDGPTHITTMYQVAQAMRAGEFPVTWLQTFAHFGSPITLYAQQTTMYLGAIAVLLFQDPAVAYKVVTAIFTLFGGTGMYLLLRQHVGKVPACIGALLFIAAPYRILNVYIRGALPEYAAQSLVPFMLYAMHTTYSTGKYPNYVLYALSVTLLVVTHSFFLIIAAPIMLGYALYLTVRKAHPFTYGICLAIASILGIGLAGWYLLPLVTEIRYFIYGQSHNHFVPQQSLTLLHYGISRWPYMTQGDIFTRPHIIQSGLLEILILLGGGVYFLRGRYIRLPELGIIAVIVAIIYIVLTLPISTPLYESFAMLGNIQHQWRMMAGVSLTIPIVAALLINRIPKKFVFLGAGMLVICLATYNLPQAYAKNYTVKPLSTYAFTREQLHGNAMFTIWSGDPAYYPNAKASIEIIEGKGTIRKVFQNHTTRKYTISAQSDVRIVDNTFYFPGWRVQSNDNEIPIEFQDHRYRGLITYKLQQGDHDILMEFRPTRKRIAGYALTVVSGICLIAMYGIFKRYATI